MIHKTLPRFWQLYAILPPAIQALADKNYALLKMNPMHPSLHLKKVSDSGIWSVRVGSNYRALGVRDEDSIVWFWIGPHAEYDKLISQL